MEEGMLLPCVLERHADVDRGAYPWSNVLVLMVMHLIGLDVFQDRICMKKNEWVSILWFSSILLYIGPVLCGCLF